MNKIFFIAADYLKGQPIYAPFRRLLNLLFNISIASFIYEKTYGKYNWLNYDNYKGVLDFFIKGSFFIPLSIFIAVSGITQFLSFVIFVAINYFKTIKWTREIIAFEVKNELIEERIHNISEASRIVTPIDLTKSMLIDLYDNLRDQISNETFDKIENEVQKPKRNLEATFHLLFRGLIAISIYFLSLPKFGWLLYLSILIIFYIGMYLIMLAYRFLDIFPILVRKFHREAEKYILSHKMDSGNNIK